MHKIEESVKNFEYKEASNSDDILVSDVLDSPITRAEITRALKNLKNHKAPGPDEIPAEFLRQGEMEIGNTMYPIFNAIAKIHQKHMFHCCWPPKPKLKLRNSVMYDMCIYIYAVRHVYAGTSATQAHMAHRAQHPVVNTVTVVSEY